MKTNLEKRSPAGQFVGGEVVAKPDLRCWYLRSIHRERRKWKM